MDRVDRVDDADRGTDRHRGVLRRRTISGATASPSATCSTPEPLGLLPTTRMFARIDAAVPTSLIRRSGSSSTSASGVPFQAIAGADRDGNAGTARAGRWTPLVPNPAYSDYTSGHAAATSPCVEVVRQTLGDDTALVLRVGSQARTYDTLTALEHDAFHARIWGGLHFRDAMDDGYYLGAHDRPAGDGRHPLKPTPPLGGCPRRAPAR